jgi:hypothetical protein
LGPVTREQLEHLVRAAAQIADDEELIVVGSQSVLGQFPDAPPALLISDEADIYPKNKPELADLIDGTIGELSPFHDTFGYYAHGIDEATPTLPEGWRDRLVPIRNANTRWATGWCLDVHDLVVSKLAAGREKDLEFALEAARHGLVEEKTLSRRLGDTELPEELRVVVEGRITRIAHRRHRIDGGGAARRQVAGQARRQQQDQRGDGEGRRIRRSDVSARSFRAQSIRRRIRIRWYRRSRTRL